MKSKLLITMSIIMMIISLGMVNVYAAYSCEIGAVSSANKIEPGKEITITVSAKDINAGEGITSIQAVLEYDTKVFEEVTASNFEKVKGWETPTYIGTTISTNTESYEGTKENQELFKIKLKAKKDAKDDKYTITLKNVKLGTDDYSTIEVKDKIIEVKVETTKQEKPTQEEPKEEPKPTTPTEKEPTTSKEEVKAEKEESKNKNDAKPKKLPKTGIAGIGITVVAIAGIGTASYMKYKKYNF